MNTQLLPLIAALWMIFCSAFPLGAQTPSFQWARRVASTANEDFEPAIGLALDSNNNVYVTGWFDGANDFGGVTLARRASDQAGFL